MAAPLIALSLLTPPSFGLESSPNVSPLAAFDSLLLSDFETKNCNALDFLFVIFFYGYLIWDTEK